MEAAIPAPVDNPPDAREANILAELYDALERRPRDVEIHEMLVETWWHRDKEVAYEVASMLLDIDHGNKIALEYLGRRRPAPATNVPRADFGSMQCGLEEGYETLKFDAKVLKTELALDSFQYMAEDQDTILSNLSSICEGAVASTVSTSQPVSAREAAREILSNESLATELIVEDLEAMLRWVNCQSNEPNAEKLRGRLLKRRSMLEAALPESVRENFVVAFWLVERDHLQRQFANTDTMLGDDIKDIPGKNLFVSEDNYVFDMDELVSAVQANGGVMRNPLSREMFSEHDIRFILNHPIGKQLKRMGEEQRRLKRGVSPATIDKIKSLGQIMLEDQSIDAGPSRKAIDEFLAYVAMLSPSEEATIKGLRIPARDKHTNQPFDYTVNESVGDAKAGVTCYHKVGDFLSQAATFLCQ